ncbi:MAG: sulfate permease [Pseudomonadota bacterium]
MRLARLLPALEWGKAYRTGTLTSDLVAAVVVTVMLIPQSLAYAMLAGLPPEVGLYASVLPLVAYALFGTSRTLAVGPVAILSLMTAAAAARVADEGSPEYAAAAISLAAMSGGLLMVLGFLRLGFLANFLSHPVVAGFIAASGVIIAVSQVKHLVGVEAHGENLVAILTSLAEHLPDANGPTAIVGVVSLAFLFWARSGVAPLLRRWGLPDRPSTLIARAAPAFAVIAGIAAVGVFRLDAEGVAVVGDIPVGMPRIAAPTFDAEIWRELLGAALLISVIGFVESVSVAQTLAMKRRESINPDQELIGLGVANLAAGVSGGYPVTGGFARSAVNFDAGAETPAAGAFTAVGIALAALYLTPQLYYLPKAVLGATIIVAVSSIIDVHALRRTFVYSKSDFAAMAATIAVTLTAGVELGVMTGVGVSLFLHLYNTSRPHFAIVGQVPGTHHFRNVRRHNVVTSDCALTIRVDESLYFANARFLEDAIYRLVAERPGLQHLVLMCSAVNGIDASGLESLEAINERLKAAGVTLHFSEVKGPVMDRLKRTDFLETLTGEVYLHQYEAIRALDADCARRAVLGADAPAPMAAEVTAAAEADGVAPSNT